MSRLQLAVFWRFSPSEGRQSPFSDRSVHLAHGATTTMVHFQSLLFVQNDFFFFTVLNVYWIFYNIASAWCFVFWPKGMWDLCSLTRDWTCNPCIGRWSLNHWRTGEVPSMILNETKLCLSLGMILFWRAEPPPLTQQDFSLGLRAATVFQEITKEPLPKWDLEMRSSCIWGPRAGSGWRITAGRQWVHAGPYPTDQQISLEFRPTLDPARAYLCPSLFFFFPKAQN